MTNREIDFYVKGLPLDVRQNIFHIMKEELNPITLEYILEKNENYTSFRKRGYTDNRINTILIETAGKFQLVNKIMEDNKRYYLFKEPKDTFNSARRLKELLTERKKTELEEIFGCTWDQYTPMSYDNRGGSETEK